MKNKWLTKLMSLVLSIALLMGVVPFSVSADGGANGGYPVGTVVDPSTAHTWESMMGTDGDGNRYAGRVWVDKSVYKHGDTALLGGDSSFEVALSEGENFQIVFSALGSTMSSKSTVTATGPMDVVLILDTSTSMDDTADGVTRLERVIQAANALLEELLTVNGVRIAVVTYNRDSETVLPLSSCTNGLFLEVTDYYNNGSSDAGVVTAYDKDKTKLGSDSGYTTGTNLQAGIDRGFSLLANATDVQGRAPVAIVLTDGQSNRANRASYYSNIGAGDSASGSQLYLSTLLNAAYNKAKVEAHYGVEQMVYGIGVDLGTNTTAKLLMNPGSTATGEGFNGSNTNRTIRDTYADFVDWSRGETVTYGNGGSRWSFDHNYPKLNGAIDDAKISANINYVDAYYDVTAAQLEDTFHQIYEELSSGAFNPITSSGVVEGATGVEHTPLIYVDYLASYMQIKNIQAVSLFGATYNVHKQGGSYVVERAEGTNPTTGEHWNTEEDIRITIVEQADLTQKLEIRINQEILPILMEQVESQTVGGVTTGTITEIGYEPLRIFYTVGLSESVLLPGGQLDVNAISGYSHFDDANGTVSFYANAFGKENTATDSSGNVIKGDSHVGFRPSAQNRYYYHQSNQSIFTSITEKGTGKAVTIPENNEFGIVWDEDRYTLTRLSYQDYLSLEDEDRVYTYVTYWHPTPSATDAANAAEEVTYLIYADWKYMKESVGFINAKTGEYLYGGKAVPEGEVSAVVAAYLAEHPDAQICAVLGMGSLRTSRLHNWTADKTQNLTDTAVESYAPEYTYETASKHNDNDVVVWLGNNGRLTVEVDTGIALTKNVTEAMGDPEDLYPLTLSVPVGVDADPTVKDATGKALASERYEYDSRVLTVLVKAGETVYVSGIPAGTVCEVNEDVPADAEYYVADRSGTVTVPSLSEVLSGAVEQYAPVFVTNAPYKYGNLFLTKEIRSDHEVPASVADQGFTLKVDLGAQMVGKTFSVLDSAHAAAYQKTVEADGTMSFSVKNGQTVEILRLPAGISVSVEEQSPDAHFEVSYRSRNHSGLADDSDGSVVIPETGSATVIVYNDYTPDPVSVDLDVVGEKNFDAPALHDGATFLFEVQKYEGGQWQPVKTANVSYAAGESGTKSFRMENVLEGIVFKRVGESAYRVVEVKGELANVSYDRTLYTFDVSVSDGGGRLLATVTDKDDAVITDGSYEVSFYNSYNTAPVSVDIRKSVINHSGDNTVGKHGFVFEAVATDSARNPLTGAEASSLRVHSDAEGQARLSAIYDTAGKYYYVLREVHSGGSAWDFSDASYFITVSVENDGTGKLSASLTIDVFGSPVAGESAEVEASDPSKGTVSFVNTYDPEDAYLDLDAAVKKELTGKTLEKDAFTFYVYPDGSQTPVLVGTNDAGGNVSFVDFAEELLLSTAGKHAFDIRESIPADAVYDAHTDRYVLNGMSYDPTVYDLIVEVVNHSDTGKLVVADYYFEDAVDNVVTFRNSYKPTPTQYTVTGSKVLHGRAMKAGEFTFELYEADGVTLLQSARNKADGSFAFAAIPYTAEGEYTYVVKEKAGNVGGVSYDTQEYTLTVSVTDTLGVLSASADVAGTQLIFENDYTAAPAQLEIRVEKSLVGAENDAPSDGDFTFRFYQTDRGFEPKKANSLLLDTRTNRNGEAVFATDLSAPGTYFFVVLEDGEVNPKENVVYDGTQYRYIVQVVDPGDGQLVAKVNDLMSGTYSASSSQLKANAAFVNALEDEVAKKEVYTEGVSLVQIDGQKVEEGQILTYHLTYNNYNGHDVTVDILDAIPAHTSYVEGSASHGGSYAGGRVNWVLTVARGESVTVSFQVKVEELEAVVANTAVMVDGVNTYYTNAVHNHTVQTPLKKDVIASDEPQLSIDGQKVEAGQELSYRITFINPTGEVKSLEIVDAIPANATYVEGSADKGGVYADGVITWSIQEVPAWGSVTVSFSVTVNADLGAAQIENTAYASDGVNRFESNLVENYTEEVPEPPVSTAPATTAPATSAPATTAPATSAPATTAPATTAPATTAPATGAPATSAPATTAPATTAPATTAPATTAPAVSEAPITGDVANRYPAFLLLLSGGGLMATALTLKKKKEREE